MPVKKIFILVLLVCLCCFAHGQVDTLPSKKRKSSVIAGTAICFSGGFYLLYQSWYKPYSVGRFHFFNDAEEWRGMDKIGHAVSASLLFDQFADFATYSGFTEKQTNWYAFGSSMVFLSAIECMDGFSDGWGFSVSDYTANLVGTSYSFLKRNSRNRHWPTLKYSWKPGALSKARPELLGYSIPERMLKNYNEQTYWLSFPLKLFFSKSPRWLCVAAGYTANGMLGARANSWTSTSGVVYDNTNIERYSALKLSLDIDLLALPLKKKWQRKLLGIVRWIKIPAPGIEVRPSTNKGVSLFLW
jgi:hypothetical protein